MHANFVIEVSYYELTNGFNFQLEASIHKILKPQNNKNAVTKYLSLNRPYQRRAYKEVIIGIYEKYHSITCRALLVQAHFDDVCAML
jgi:hypothetical protein